MLGDRSAESADQASSEVVSTHVLHDTDLGDQEIPEAEPTLRDIFSAVTTCT